MAEMSGENILIFKAPEEDLGEFSNQYPAPFTYMGIRFETVEQFLYYMKAIFGRSKATAEKILSCGGDSSALSKASRKQRILENNSWEAVRPQIMRIGMRQKFLQNPELRKKLLATGFHLLAEMPREGILERLIPGNEDWIRDPGKWKGRNLTGRILMQVRADLRCADRLVGPDDVYVFPREPFILKTQIGQMGLKEIASLPGARESVRTYAEIAQQYQELLLANADDFISRHTIPLVTMERAISSNEADIENALNRARARAEEAGNAGNIEKTESAGETGAEPTAEAEAVAATAAEPFGGPAADAATADAAAADVAAAEAEPAAGLLGGAFGEPAAEHVADGKTAVEPVADPAGEKLPDDIPGEGFYELLFDLDEMMKLGII